MSGIFHFAILEVLKSGIFINFGFLDYVSFAFEASLILQLSQFGLDFAMASFAMASFTVASFDVASFAVGQYFWCGGQFCSRSLFVGTNSDGSPIFLEVLLFSEHHFASQNRSQKS